MTSQQATSTSINFNSKSGNKKLSLKKQNQSKKLQMS